MPNARPLYSLCTLEGGTRLDKLLHEALASPRSQVAQWVETGLVFVDKTKARKASKVARHSLLEIYSGQALAAPKPSESALAALHIEVIEETKDYLILNKPRNLVTHPAPSVRELTLVDYLRFHNYELSTLGGQPRCGLVHRLDKDTSGAILIAKNNESHAYFSELLKARTMGRIYLCIISPPLQQNCVVECHLGRNPTNRLKMAKLDPVRFPKARESKSEFVGVLKSRDSKYELVSVRLFSGRTHQIRVHLSTLGRYIYGDRLYSPDYLGRNYETSMLLHATLLYFDGRVFSAKLPKDLLEFLAKHFENYEEKIEANLSRWQGVLSSSLKAR